MLKKSKKIIGKIVIFLRFKSYTTEQGKNGQTFLNFIKEVGVFRALWIIVLNIFFIFKKLNKLQKDIKVSEIEGSFDNASFDDLIKNGDYRWDLLLSDIKKYGVLYPISICQFGKDCHPSRHPSKLKFWTYRKKYSCLAGNHRLRVLQLLDITSELTVKAKCDKYPCKTGYDKFTDVAEFGDPIIGT